MAVQHSLCSPQNHREGRDVWRSPRPCPCTSRATQSHLPNLPGLQRVAHVTVCPSAHPSTHPAVCSCHHPSQPTSSVLKHHTGRGGCCRKLWKCSLQKIHRAALDPLPLLQCGMEARSSEPHCWSERSSHLAKPADHRSMGTIFKTSESYAAQLQQRYPCTAFTLQPHGSWERDCPPKSRLKDAPGALASALTVSASVTAFTPAAKKALTLPQPPLDFPDTSSPKEVTTDRGEASRRPDLLPSQEHRRQQQTLCPCLFPTVLPSSNIHKRRGEERGGEPI